MEDKGSLNIHINIYGGTNQILPNATKAAQYFHRDAELTVKPALAEPPHPWTSEDESRLSLYIEEGEHLPTYVATLSACTTAQQVGEAVAEMCVNEPKLDGELIAKERFIRLLLPFLVKVEKGKGIDNLRVNINNAWLSRKKQLKKASLG